VSPEGKRAMEYLFVEFPEVRDVIANGKAVGPTNSTIFLGPNQYKIRLSGTGYTPAVQTVVLSGTTVATPVRIAFQLAAPPAAGV
jgi:hypothetical protein